MQSIFIQISGGMTSDVDDVILTLAEQVRCGVQDKRPDLVDSVIILHGNARPHKAECVPQLLRHWRWKELEHLQDSPDISLCDFDLIPKIKELIRGRVLVTLVVNLAGLTTGSAGLFFREIVLTLFLQRGTGEGWRHQRPPYQDFGHRPDFPLCLTPSSVRAGKGDTRFGYGSSSPLDIGILKSIHTRSQVNSLPELSSDHNPVHFYFRLKTKFEVPPPQLFTNWNIFKNELLDTNNLNFMNATNTNEIDSQIQLLTTQIINVQAKASKPIYHSYNPLLRGELKTLIKDRNKAKKQNPIQNQTAHLQLQTKNVVRISSLSLR
ncbi:uncharacterized protein TNCT_2871 [Trichonephila clavata]|uniref:Endonuclease/exonuclease/phosphatase domain-containing protein n=1 Tax=Trichonephila clavata TaxID=2740835 RepID=A0A8X6IGX4_TRICU|nr:uncharacterized protein TNCT_2871 [Trichonephila clavata]